MEITYERLINDSWQEVQAEVSFPDGCSRAEFIDVIATLGHDEPIRGTVALPCGKTMQFNLDFPPNQNSIIPKFVKGTVQEIT